MNTDNHHLRTKPEGQTGYFNPHYYRLHPTGIECIEISEEWSLNLGCALKYMWRNGMKPGEEATDDLRKAVWFINREIQRYQRKMIKTPQLEDNDE